jgi:hypothetical protein
VVGTVLVKQAGAAQAPWEAIDTLLAEASQAFEYVFPSQPQTGT